MARLKSGKGRYNFLIDSSVYDEFSLLCEEIGIVRSKNLEIFMKKFIKENSNILKKRGKDE